MRVLLYTGKGGVGKTTVAAATAVRSAQLGHRTIVLSTDAAHSLSDSFEVPLSGEAVAVAANLWGQETNITDTMETYWRDIEDWMSALMAWRGMEQIVADELAILPGMEELANLLYITNYYYGGDFDVVVVDCAPTGDTLRLLSFPEVLGWWMDKMFPIGRTAVTMTRPFVRRVVGMPVPDDRVFASVERLYAHLDKMHELLTDPKKSSVRLVVNPEKMVIKEAQRSFTYFTLYGYATDLVVCNRLLPDDVTDPYFESWKESQSRYYKMIEEAFSPIPILAVPLMHEEVVGISRLERLAEVLFGDRDPADIFFHGQAHDIVRENGCYVLALPLPFSSKDSVSLMRNGDELVVRVGNHRRNIILPRTLSRLPVRDARFDNDTLRIRFDVEEENA
ncbi:MAG: TRC40/GET3/ArsA family transport-energizing ATPase [Chloroflexota bacterium]|nr:TRC40/GET3/ArsA family transport-energizing ATPase [Chloroflexota bacterium]